MEGLCQKAIMDNGFNGSPMFFILLSKQGNVCLVDGALAPFDKYFGGFLLEKLQRSLRILIPVLLISASQKRAHLNQLEAFPIFSFEIASSMAILE